MINIKKSFLNYITPAQLLSISERRNDGFMPFPTKLASSEMQIRSRFDSI